MKFRTAKELVRVNINALSLEQLQKHKVKVHDAMLQSEAFFGMGQAIMDGYYVHVHDSSSNFWTPRDMFLTTNLSYIYGECIKREQALLGIS